MEALKKLLKGHKTLVFIDFEGTQFTHEIIAVGAYKCKVNDEGEIIERAENGYKQYVQATSQVGKYITEMTSITDSFLEANGVPVDVMLEELKAYIHEDLRNVSYVVFGSNDARMILETNKHSHPSNQYILKQIIPNIVDYLAFLSQYVRDDNFNSYSLTNYLKVFEGEPYGVSHDPLNDAIDLMNLYDNVLKNPDILLDEYKKNLLRQKIFPTPVKNLLKKIIETNEGITKEEFISLLKDYLS